MLTAPRIASNAGSSLCSCSPALLVVSSALDSLNANVSCSILRGVALLLSVAVQPGGLCRFKMASRAATFSGSSPMAASADFSANSA